MKCKNPKCDNEHMDTDETSQENGMTTVIRVCLECGWSSKSWYELDECHANHTSWLDEEENETN